MNEHDFVCRVGLSNQRRVPFAVRDFAPDAIAAGPNFYEPGASHVVEVARQLLRWPIKRHQLDNVPAITHGPRAGGAHTLQEWVSIDDLTRVAKVYALTAIEFC